MSNNIYIVWFCLGNLIPLTNDETKKFFKYHFANNSLWCAKFFLAGRRQRFIYVIAPVRVTVRTHNAHHHSFAQTARQFFVLFLSHDRCTFSRSACVSVRSYRVVQSEVLEPLFILKKKREEKIRELSKRCVPYREIVKGISAVVECDAIITYGAIDETSEMTQINIECNPH